MFPWLWIWAPQFYFPLSGSVKQDIDPDIFLAAGDAEVEQRVLEFASYGRQIGWISELVIDLAQKDPGLSQSSKPLQKLQILAAKIEDIKEDEARQMAQHIETQLKKLQQGNPHEFAQLSFRLQKALALAAD